MDRKIELHSGEKVFIEGNGLRLCFSLGENHDILSSLSTLSEAHRIMVRQHKEDHKILIFQSEE